MRNHSCGRSPTVVDCSGYWVVECRECGVEETTDLYGEKSDAVAAWDRRATTRRTRGKRCETWNVQTVGK